MSFVLRQYQQDAIDSIYSYFRRHDGNPIVVVPTGGGKSLIQAEFIRRVLRQDPLHRFLLLTHVKELLQQNGHELLTLCPELATKIGYYSAGMGQKCHVRQITIAGIQSAFRSPWKFKGTDLIIVDECHLVPKKGFGMYLKLINGIREHSPKVKVIGLTATPFRLDSGMLTDGKDSIFTDICYQTDLGQMIKDGYLSPIKSKIDVTNLDLKKIQVRAGDYVLDQLQSFMSQEHVVRSAVENTIKIGHDRKKWLVFCSGISHAEAVQNELSKFVSCKLVTGDTPREERSAIINGFKNGHIKALININVLTTGFNVPDVDMIVMLRPTKSTSLYVQQIGRGMRVAPGKVDCLILDFAGNILEHGPVNLIKIKKSIDGTDEVEKSPQKECPECRDLCHISARECPSCGHIFFADAQPKHSAVPETNADVFSEQIKWHDVDLVRYGLHRKIGSPSSLRVEYQCGLRMFREWICFNHIGYPRQKAILWWKKFNGGEVPVNSEDAVLRSGDLSKPKRILVSHCGKYPTVISHDLNLEKERAA